MMPKGWPTELYLSAYWNVAKSNACDKLERWEGGIFPFFQADLCSEKGKGEGVDIFRDWIHFKVWIPSWFNFTLFIFFLLPACQWLHPVFDQFPFDSDLNADKMGSGVKSSAPWNFEIWDLWTFSGNLPGDKVQLNLQLEFRAIQPNTKGVKNWTFQDFVQRSKLSQSCICTIFAIAIEAAAGWMSACPNFQGWWCVGCSNSSGPYFPFQLIYLWPFVQLSINDVNWMEVMFWNWMEGRLMRKGAIKT